MLREHEQFADFIGMKKNPEEDEYSFRKRIFLEVYSKGENMALEIFFSVGYWRSLSLEHKAMVEELRGEFEVQKNEHTLKTFLERFEEDPAKEYEKNYI